MRALTGVRILCDRRRLYAITNLIFLTTNTARLQASSTLRGSPVASISGDPLVLLDAKEADLGRHVVVSVQDCLSPLKSEIPLRHWISTGWVSSSAGKLAAAMSFIFDSGIAEAGGVRRAHDGSTPRATSTYTIQARRDRMRRGALPNIHRHAAPSLSRGFCDGVFDVPVDLATHALYSNLPYPIAIADVKTAADARRSR
ncbi:hypothetical protein DFH06DRAFT_1344548 [Mycena polygramma]|nr:hypothetical protein DFH06DRAFT_1344548 [Mycena polygramma]